jgi:hypothetical protein
MTCKLIGTAIFSGFLVAFAPGIAEGDPIPKKGTTSYVAHYVHRPLETIDAPGFKVTALESVGTTENLKGEKMFDKMAARCVSVNIDTGPERYVNGACVLTDSDGDKIFSTYDSRDIDKAMGAKGASGTHIITGGTGKYAGITGKEPFASESMPALAGPGDYTSRDVVHIATWEISR